jgi:argininosuccinate lyase
MSRFSQPQDPLFQALDRSLEVDRRLWPYDVAQSRAHSAMLAAQGIISADDKEAIHEALDQVELELGQGRFPFRDDDVDIHMAIERRVTELAGPSGGKIHTARSRNDQVATDLALYTRDHAIRLADQVEVLARTLIEVAGQHMDWALPGYTHLQRAQPVYLSHHLLAYVWMLVRDRERFRFAARQADVLPLGAGALAGVNFATDRTFVARELGFAGVVPNSIDAVSNRDFALDLLQACAVLSTHLSRLGAEIVLWTSSEFGFMELSDAWSSGSSLMPQKKNPDCGELLRGKAPRVVGHLAALHGVMHALPLTYNKDLQEDKEHVFDAVDTVGVCLDAANGMLSTARFNRPAMAAAASDENIAATDIADWLVKRGLPFRDSHGVVAGIVRAAVESGRTLSSLSLDELRVHSELFDESIANIFEQGTWLESKVSVGGTSLARVSEQLQQALAVLDL